MSPATRRRRCATRRPDASVSSRLTRAFAAYVVLLLLVGAAGLVSVVAVSTTRGVELRQERLGEANTTMMLSMTSAESSIRGYRLTADPAFLAPYDDARLRYARDVRRALDQARGADERDMVLAQGTLGRYWFDDLAPPVVAAVARDGQSLTTPAQARVFKEVSARYRSLNTDLGALADRRAQEAGAGAVRAQTVALVLGALALALSLAAAVVVHQRLHRVLVVPLGAVVTTLGRLSAGRHDARADADLGPREVQVVASSLNTLADEADRLRAEQAASARYQDLAVEISRELRDEVVGGDPISTTLRRLGEVLDVDRVYVRVLAEGEHTEDTHQWNRPPWAPLASAPADEAYDRTTAARLAEHHSTLEPWACQDTVVRAREDRYVARYVERTGARAALVVPVGASDAALGLLTAMTMGGPRAWTHDEERLMTSVAADLGRALVVRRLLEQQERLVDRLRELDRTKTEFVATVSHELRTPLTSIAGYVEMVREGDGGEVPAAMDAMLVVVERNTARLRLLIEDLLTLSRIESGTYRVSHGEVAPVQVASTAVQSLRPVADKARVGVHLDLGGPAEGAALVSGDPGQLERAVGNLLSNAVKFTPAGGLVRVAVRLAEDRVVVEIADTGIGIPQAEQEHLFTRFFRASNATELAIQGTGLGLTIVRSIVELHEGTLTVASVSGQGTTVTVDLPRLAGPASAAAVVASRAAVAAAVATAGHHEAAGAPLVAR